jgi:hypothetical protein
LHFYLCENAHISINFFLNELCFFSFKFNIRGNLARKFRLADCDCCNIRNYGCYELHKCMPGVSVLRQLLYGSRHSQLIEMLRKDGHGYCRKKQHSI